MPDLAAFLVVAGVVIVTPGPDTALTIGNTLRGGRLSGVFTGAGVAAGQATWTIFTSAGIAALVVASEPVFRAVKYAGAGYLVFLGVQALRAAARRGSTGADAMQTNAPSHLTPRVALRQGLISNLTNPKMITFFPALLPQFAPPGSSTFIVLLALGLLFASMTLLWLIGYACVVAKAGDFIRRSRVQRMLEAATGVVLISLGLRLATESHR
jgi:threonine/homoserine/homoserine lactone efflux protein